MPRAYRTDFRPVELAMRIAIARRLSVRGIMTRYSVSRATAYRYLRLWCDLHGVELIGERHHVGPNFYLGAAAEDFVYERPSVDVAKRKASAPEAHA